MQWQKNPCRSAINTMVRRFKNYSIDDLSSAGVKVRGLVAVADDVILHNPCNITLGNNVRIDTQCVLIAGENHEIVIGDNVHISAGCYFYGNSGNIIIGDCACTSARCTIYTANDDYTEGFVANSVMPKELRSVKTGDVILENHVLVGCASVILPGVTLGYATSVGAHSLVKNSTESFYIIGGVPAKFIKKRKNKYLQQ